MNISFRHCRFGEGAELGPRVVLRVPQPTSGPVAAAGEAQTRVVGGQGTVDGSHTGLQEESLLVTAELKSLPMTRPTGTSA